MTELLLIHQARDKISSQIRRLSTERVNIIAVLDRVLAEDIQARIDLPPFANSSMDGYAIRAEDVHDANQDHPIGLAVVMDVPAGFVPSGLLSEGQAARIMTGAVVPDGANAVVPVEETDSTWTTDQQMPLPTQVKIFRSVAIGDYIRPKGLDLASGTTVIESGTFLRPQHIGMLAALGQSSVMVHRRPRVVILSHGDELVDISDDLAPGKIRDVNRYTLAGLVADCGGEPITLPIAKDTIEDLRRLFMVALEQKPDMIISSGGVSVGVTDFVRPVLRELGEVAFWRINLRPGKPVAFGQLRGIPFFGLPGNPVSAMVTFDVLVRPALFKQAGRTEHILMAQAVVSEDMQSDGRRSYLRVKLDYVDERLIARSVGSQSSSTLMSMVLADGLLIVPEDMIRIPAGITLPVRILRPLKGTLLSFQEQDH